MYLLTNEFDSLCACTSPLIQDIEQVAASIKIQIIPYIKNFYKHKICAKFLKTSSEFAPLNFYEDLNRYGRYITSGSYWDRFP
uniref:Uncharacterized protein n=1 Tax=Rhizophagus irregularis (strain DAOM 181602 / DAOM 197198 / MUCL 43194) TaxID=747089 RepID=U9U0F3_RHIID